MRAVARAEKIASPSAAPSCSEVLIRPAASPAWWAGTPALAATVAPTKIAPSPSDIDEQAGEQVGQVIAVYGDAGEVVDRRGGDECAGDETGRVPMRANSFGESAAATPRPAVTGR